MSTSFSIARFAHNLELAAGRALVASVDAGEKDARGTKLWNDGEPPAKRLFTRSTIKGWLDLSQMKGGIRAKGASTWLQWGTRDHGPTSAPAMVWRSRTGIHHAKWVRGIKATHFMTHAQMMAKKTLHYGIEFHINRVIQGGHG